MIIYAGVPLEDCPMCPDLECVPLIVRTCCNMVEEKGLDIVGIYRVPGNSAAVNALTEQVGRPSINDVTSEEGVSVKNILWLNWGDKTGKSDKVEHWGDVIYGCSLSKLRNGF